MTRMRPFRLAATMAALLGLACCAGYSGPIYGDWRGNQPTSLGLYPTYRRPRSSTARPAPPRGQYDFQANRTDPGLFNGGDRTVSWGDRWTLAPTSASGSVPILVLHNLPSSQISRYAMLPNDRLVPLTLAGVPDTTSYGLHYALVPVPRGTSWRFGRL